MSNLFRKALVELKHSEADRKEPLTFSQFKKQRQKMNKRKAGWPEKGYVPHSKAYQEYLAKFQNLT